jgi:hypothetical protein
MYGGCPDDYEPEGAMGMAMVVLVIVVAMVCLSIKFGGVDIKWPLRVGSVKAECMCRDVKDGE